MKIASDVTLRLAANETNTLALVNSSECDRVVITPRFSQKSSVKISDNILELPSFEAPEFLTLDWQKDGVSAATTYVELVSRHYFDLAALKNYGDGQDDFAELDEELLFAARQAATEIFESDDASHRSFVHRLGRTKDYGGRSFITLRDFDVYELITDGYRLVSDCQVEPTGENVADFPRWIDYKFGADSIPAQVSRAVLELAAYMLRPSNRPVGATGESTDAGYIHFTTAGRDGATDIPEVNAAAQQFGRQAVAVW